ncbi:MAG: peptidylprolyl isomerase [Ottowia sp.]
MKSTCFTGRRLPAAMAALVLAALCAGGAARAAGAGDAVMVTGPAGPMTRAEVEAMVRDLVPAAERPRFLADPDAVAGFARSLYAQRLLAADALKAGLDATPEGQAYLKQLRERALAELLLRERERAALPSDQVLESYARSDYKAKPERFRQPEQVRARHILLAVAPDGSNDAAVKARAEKLLADLRGGADFAALARQLSADKGSAARGGDLGLFGRGKMVPEFDAAAFALRKPGELAGPVKTKFGYHVIELLERKPAELRPFEQVLPELREEVRARVMSAERKALWSAAQERVQVDEAVVKALSAEQPPIPLPKKP